jgi:hypothetical protein
LGGGGTGDSVASALRFCRIERDGANDVPAPVGLGGDADAAGNLDAVTSTNAESFRGCTARGRGVREYAVLLHKAQRSALYSALCTRRGSRDE